MQTDRSRYETPRAGLAEVATPLTKLELIAFVGPNSAYYVGQWMTILAGKARATKFNWAAFFLMTGWLGYRRMYRVAALVIAAASAAKIVEYAVFMTYLGQPDVPWVVDRAIFLATAFVCGRYGSVWYLRHAQREIARATQSLGSDSDELLLSKVGTSWVGVVLVILISLPFMLFTALAVVAIAPGAFE